MVGLGEGGGSARGCSRSSMVQHNTALRGFLSSIVYGKCLPSYIFSHGDLIVCRCLSFRSRHRFDRTPPCRGATVPCCHTRRGETLQNRKKQCRIPSWFPQLSKTSCDIFKT